jgi:NAD(P)-dependent dehydrogenase (short-subunit alcohol dehydrogenase family)
MELKGKRILITGASSGIGRAISVFAASSGARLIIIGRDEGRLLATFNSLEGDGHQYIIADVTDYDHLESKIKEIITEGDPISGFVHSAGLETTAVIKATSIDVLRELFEINVFAAFQIVRLITRRAFFNPLGGSIVFISSVMGKLGEAGKLAYSSSKSALLAGSKSIAIELARKNIRCNCILPGIVETEMSQKLFDSIPEEARARIISRHPLGLGKPEDIGALAVFLLSDYSRWITGSDFVIDGGYSAQ